MPDFIPPLLPVLQALPPSGDEWLHEVKYDGYRVQLRIEDGVSRALTRRGHDWTHLFRDIAAAAATLSLAKAIIDGEVVAVRPNGVTSYRDLLAALSGTRKAPLYFYAFDLLWLDATDLRRLPLLERKDHLRALVPGGPAHALLYSEHMAGDGPELLPHFCDIGLEGIVSKRADSRYISGRNDAWRKAKCTEHRSFVIGGWRPPEARVRGVGSLLVGAYDDKDRLVYAGTVGTGWTVATSIQLQKRLKALGADRSPFVGRSQPRKALWVRPELVCDVAFAEWEPPHELRHASFKGLREDVAPGEVVAEAE